MKYTISQFRKEFPSDDVCLDRIFSLRYSQQPCCPQCSQETVFKRIPDRRCYQCSDPHCQYQLYPTAGTIFEKTRTPLVDWFYAIYLMTSTRNGVSAKELQRQLGVTYKTAFRMGHQIRKLMDTKHDGSLMTGIIEADETFIGSNPKNKHAKHKNKYNNYGRRDFDPVVALVQRNGKVVTKVVEDTKSYTLSPIFKENVDIKQATLITDANNSYNFIGKQFREHHSIKHQPDNYITVGFKHTNSVEGFFSHLKRTIKGTHIKVSTKHLQAYANECAFRYTYRKQGQGMFFTILNQISWKELKPFSEAQRSPLGELDFLLKP